MWFFYGYKNDDESALKYFKDLMLGSVLQL